MKKWYYVFLIWIMLSLLLTGCWSRRELNELAIATALGIDKTNDGYLVTVQVVNPSQVAGKTVTTRTEVVTFSITGETVFEALRKLTIEAPRKIFVSNIKTIVLGEELAKDGIYKTLDFISRDHEMRTNFYITVARNTTANRILQIQTALEKIPSMKIANTLESAEKNWSAIKTVELDELISSLTSPGKQPVLTGIKYAGDDDFGASIQNVERVHPITRILADTIAVFYEDRLKGWLTEEESMGYNYITDNVENTVEVIEYNGCTITIETMNSKTKVSGKVKGDLPSIQIEVQVRGNIGELQCPVDITQNATIKEIENEYADIYKEHMRAAIDRAQTEFNSDIFGFGEVIYRAHPKEWKKIQDQWSEIFPTVDVQIKVDAQIQDIGTITNSFIR